MLVQNLLSQVDVVGGEPQGPLVVAGILGGAVAVGLLVHLALYWLAPRGARRTPGSLDDVLLDRLRRPSSVLFPLLALRVVSTILDRGTALGEIGSHLISLLLILAVTWLAISVVFAIEHWLLSRYDVEAEDNLRARSIHTQARVLSRVLVIVLGIVGIGAALMTFPQVRQVGMSLLASAGLAGLVVGFAARQLLSNLIAGVMIAFTEPIRLDDVVIVEGEWGRIEKLTPTYVVMKIWDERRMVVPLSYFLEKPFENWTRETANILGTVVLHTDYTAPVEELREELKRIVEASEHWDGRVCSLQVTDSTSESVQVRCVISAADATKVWNLRCEVREKMIGYLQRERPRALPRIRAEVRTRSAQPG